MRRECTCRGMNENCCFCSGSGYIDGARTMTPLVPAGKIKRVKSKAEEKFEQKIAKSRQPIRPITNNCPHCTRTFGSGKKLTHHIISVHADTVQIFRCSYCTKPFLEEYAMNCHMQSCKMKNRRSQSAISKPHGKSSHASQIKRPDARGSGARPNDRRSVYQDPKKERLLDGSRGSHMFRDHGRFGSHSTHDDHGDDSNP